MNDFCFSQPHNAQTPEMKEKERESCWDIPMIPSYSSVCLSSTKEKAGTPTASTAIKTAWKHVLRKATSCTRVTVKQSPSKYRICWCYMSETMFYSSFPHVYQKWPVLCQKTKAPVSPWSQSIIMTMQRRTAVCSYIEAAKETQTDLIPERIARSCVSVSSSLFSGWNPIMLLKLH